MRWFRRHRGAQSEDLAPVVRIAVASDKDPEKIARELAAVFTGRRSPARLNARQVITATLMDDAVLAGHLDRVPALVDRLMLDLGEAGLEIVAREDVE